jgi:hypothetical protein
MRVHNAPKAAYSAAFKDAVATSIVLGLMSNRGSLAEYES